MDSLEKYTLADPAVVQDPYPYYALLREHDPVHFDEGIQSWLVTRYEDVQTAARNIEVFSNELGFAQAVRAPFQDEIDEYMRREGHGPHVIADNLQVDPPVHARRRRLVNNSFTAQKAAQMEQRIRELTQVCIAEFIDRGHADFVKELAVPIPILTICDALGFSLDHVEEISESADSLVSQIGLGSTSKEEGYEHARNVMRLQNLVMEKVAERRKKPGEDLISQFINARIDDSDAATLNDAELLSMSVVAVAGGVETTRNGIAWAMYTLATRPDLLKRLQQAKNQQKEIQRFIEEVLRFYTPVPQLPRCTRSETELGGKVIPAGANVWLCWASANRDSAKFDHPDEFDMDRGNNGRHVTFGTGIHHCIGAMLARMEMKCAISEVIQRVKSLSLAVPQDKIDYAGSKIVIRGPRHLPLRFELLDA